MQRLNLMDWLASVIAALGGLNVALIGFCNYDLLSKLATTGVWYGISLAVGAAAVRYLVADVWAGVRMYEASHAIA